MTHTHKNTQWPLDFTCLTVISKQKQTNGTLRRSDQSRTQNLGQLTHSTHWKLPWQPGNTAGCHVRIGRSGNGAVVVATSGSKLAEPLKRCSKSNRFWQPKSKQTTHKHSNKNTRTQQIVKKKTESRVIFTDYRLHINSVQVGSKG